MVDDVMKTERKTNYQQRRADLDLTERTFQMFWLKRRKRLATAP